jgi:glycosyltransferase involved in cell wall biosynthesis
MKISYAITVCNEAVEIQRLISFLLEFKRTEDEIVVLFDESKNCNAVEDYLRSHSINGEFNWHKGKFEGHFADWKNKLNSLCSGDYIFQIDADEIPHSSLIESLPFILEYNESDIILVPRVNTLFPKVDENYIKKWGWKMNQKGWIQWPDHQWRIYKNTPEIKWVNKIHEVLEGYKNYANLPEMEEYALYHPKTVEKQEKQNNYYNTL